ncbi:hypothetical protein NicSoilB11_05830 [Arthrobacter sp. NicSoilB11]|nr:hypothetical protein NicSoilB11_05830 [Arthrobacter sp. NicSoilB11]
MDQGSYPLTAAERLPKKFLKSRNPLGVRSDYPYEVPVWNLSPITFQTGSFVFRPAGFRCREPATARLPGAVALPAAVVTEG